MTAPITFEAALERKGFTGFPLLVAVAGLAVLMIDGVDIQLLSLVAPVIIREWGISRAAFGPALAAALIGMTGGALAGGWLGDRIGRLRALVLSALLFGTATISAGFTTQVGTMTALRVVGGIGFGAASPNVIALASEWAPSRWRAQITSLLSIGTPAGGMLGASLVLLVLPSHGWPATFIVCGLGSCLFALLLWAVLRESPAYLLGRGRLAAAHEAARPVLHEGEVLGALAPSGAASSPLPGSGSRLFDRHLARLNIGTGIAFFFVALVAYGQLAWTTVIFSSAGLSLGVGVRAIFAFNLCSMVAAILSGFAIRYLGSRIVMLVSCGALFLSLAGLWALFGTIEDSGSSARSEMLAIVLTGLSGGTAGAVIAAIYAMMTEGYPPSCRGVGLGLGLTLGRAGGIVLSLAGGGVLEMAAGRTGPFFAILMVSTLFAATGALVSNRHAMPAKRVVKNRDAH